MTDKIQALIDLVESAPGPDRELDAAIMFDLFAQPVGREESDGGPSGYLWPEDDPVWSFGIRFPGKDRDWIARVRRKVMGETLVIERDGALVVMNSLRVPKLTSSIEAGLALAQRLLPGASWNVDSRPMARVCVAGADGVSGLFDNHPKPATPELALIAATLRALCQKDKDDG